MHVIVGASDRARRARQFEALRLDGAEEIWLDRRRDQRSSLEGAKHDMDVELDSGRLMLHGCGGVKEDTRNDRQPPKEAWCFSRPRLQPGSPRIHSGPL